MYNCTSRPSFPVTLRKRPRPSVNPRPGVRMLSSRRWSVSRRASPFLSLSRPSQRAHVFTETTARCVSMGLACCRSSLMLRHHFHQGFSHTVGPEQALVIKQGSSWSLLWGQSISLSGSSLQNGHCNRYRPPLATESFRGLHLPELCWDSLWVVGPRWVSLQDPSMWSVVSLLSI